MQRTECSVVKNDSGARFVPKTEVRETPQSWEVALEVPGADEKSVDITLEADRMVVKAGVQSPEVSEFQLVHGEYRIGGYEQTLRLPETVDREKVGAVVRHGVLRLTLPKLPEVQARKVAVTAG